MTIGFITFRKCQLHPRHDIGKMRRKARYLAKVSISEDVLASRARTYIFILVLRAFEASIRCTTHRFEESCFAFAIFKFSLI